MVTFQMLAKGMANTGNALVCLNPKRQVMVSFKHGSCVTKLRKSPRVTVTAQQLLRRRIESSIIRTQAAASSSRTRTRISRGLAFSALGNSNFRHP